MLDGYKKAHFFGNFFFILADANGVVLECDKIDPLLKPGAILNQIHPFFYCLDAINEESETRFNFHCVHLNFGKKVLSADIEITKKNNDILIVIQDLTEHYTSSQAITQTRNESIINEQLISLKNLELEAREQFKDQFIQNFSHELRNPLTNISMLASLLGNTDLDLKQKEILEYLRQSNRQLSTLLEDILSISMISSGKLRLRSALFRFHELLKLIEFTYNAKTKNKKLGFKLTIGKNVPDYVEGDRLRLFQVLTNLLDNALKFTKMGHIFLEVSLNQKRANKVSLHFKITDTGVGIAEENVATIFERFSQLDSDAVEKGTGLGLSIVNGLIALMDGKIDVETQLGKGSTFHFDVVLKLPLQAVIIDINKKNRQSVKATKRLKDQRKHKILIVEDDERTQILLFSILAATERFYINLVDDGGKVMEDIVNNNYDAIIMDVNLPNISGDHLTRVIRDFPFAKVKNIPIIGLTANAFDIDSKAYLKAGMNMVISKPFDSEKLIDALFKLLK